MFLVAAGAHSEHVQAIICDIKPGSVEGSGDVEMRLFSKKSKGYPLRNHFLKL
jgi:hypothetical protein